MGRAEDGVNDADAMDDERDERDDEEVIGFGDGGAAPSDFEDSEEESDDSDDAFDDEDDEQPSGFGRTESTHSGFGRTASTTSVASNHGFGRASSRSRMDTSAASNASSRDDEADAEGFGDDDEFEEHERPNDASSRPQSMYNDDGFAEADTASRRGSVHSTSDHDEIEGLADAYAAIASSSSPYSPPHPTVLTTPMSDDEDDEEACLLFAEPDWQEFYEDGNNSPSEAILDEGDAVVPTMAKPKATTMLNGPVFEFANKAIRISHGMDDFEDDAVSLRSIDLFVPTKLDTVVEEDEPVDAESVYSFSEDEKGDYHAWLRLTVVQQGKTLSSRPKWKEKWCRLTDGQLHFQISPNPKVDEKESKMIEMASIQLIVQDETGEHPDRFAMVSGRQTYYCLTRDEQATLVWVKHLLQAKQTSAHRLGIRQRTSP